MAANPNPSNQNQPNKEGSQGQQGQGAWKVQQNQTQGQQTAGRDQGSRSFGSNDRSGSQNDETARYLDAIEDNVRKLRACMRGGQDESSESRSSSRGNESSPRGNESSSSRSL